jgi:hypothetical protein
MVRIFETRFRIFVNEFLEAKFERIRTRKSEFEFEFVEFEYESNFAPFLKFEFVESNIRTPLVLASFPSGKHFDQELGFCCST